MLPCLHAFGQEKTNRIAVKLYTNFSYSAPVETEGPGQSTGYLRIEEEGYIRAGYFTPGVVFERAYGDRSIDLRLAIRRTDSPTLPLEDRTTSTIDLLGFPARVHVRFGVGLRL